MQRNIDERTTDPISVFGQKEPETKKPLTTTEFKDNILQKEMFSKDVRNSSPYRRLKLVMDYWCALWFWPIEKANLLPSHAEFLFDLTLVLEGNLYDSDVDERGQQLLFPDTRPKQMSLTMLDEFGYVNVDKLCEENERFGLVKESAERYRYLHWELEFANLFESRGGFDLMIGNPPWIKVTWNESGILGDTEPLFVLRNYSASKFAELRDNVLGKFEILSDYLSSYEESEATQNYLNGYQNYPLLKGMQTNLYKCFLPQAWFLGRNDAIASFLHPEGIYDDSKGSNFREEVYQRLSGHFQFQNEMKLFPIGNRNKFSINIFHNKKNNAVEFVHIANLFTPSTIDSCFNHNGIGTVPGIKDGDKWSIQGHKDRIVICGIKELTLFAKLYDPEGTPSLMVRLPAVHSSQIVKVLIKIAKHNSRLEDIKSLIHSVDIMWHETNAQKDGTLKRETCFPKMVNDWIISGPHFFLGNPFFQTPKEKCNTHRAYDVLDLSQLSDNYLPRTNYIRKCTLQEYTLRTPRFKKNGLPMTDYYRLAHRRMLSQSGERTFVSVIIPKFAGLINTCVSTAFTSNYDLINFYGFSLSIVCDFFIKTTGKSDCYADSLLRFPLIRNSLISSRALILNCLSSHYADLWQSCWKDKYKVDSWAKEDQRLPISLFSNLTPKWQHKYALRTDYSRRQALVEIDVLVSMAIGLTLPELKIIYRVQFPVMRQYEANTWYDKNGRIVFTNSKGLTGIGLPRKASKTESIGWEDIKAMKSGTVVRTFIDNTMHSGPIERTITYEAPFDRCDREKDYEVVWAEFERRFKEHEGKA
jgi:hypothetical protein